MTPDTSAKYIELNAFIRIKGFAGTGGRAKLFIRGGAVKVNGETETRNKRKLHAGDIVEALGKRYVVEEALLR